MDANTREWAGRNSGGIRARAARFASIRDSRPEHLPFVYLAHTARFSDGSSVTPESTECAEQALHLTVVQSASV
ncbi:MAG: hypothetical protein BWX48_03293 [Verrucomicrobia bacterium ADurb.Bin006]|nr:MAG: hypothetical protein BWX48_03293 [Verrucomicrobia bacterium ADurb.Bin006]